MISIVIFFFGQKCLNCFRKNINIFFDSLSHGRIFDGKNRFPDSTCMQGKNIIDKRDAEMSLVLFFFF